jgi:LysR family glycine cleavage system transcriptional activator
MDLQNIRCFVAAATAPTFAAAARSVALSPASFSERVKALEDALDVDLFVQHGRRKVPSSDGERLLPTARAILRDVDGLRALAWSEETTAPWALTLGTRFELGLSWLVPLLGVLEQEVPQRCIHLAFGDTRELMRRLGDDVDAVVTSARLAGERLVTVPLHPEHYAFVGSAALLRRLPLRQARDAPQHTLIDADPGLPLFRYFLDATPASETWSFQRTSWLGSIAAIRARVLDGAGVAVLPRSIIAADLRQRRLRALLPRRALLHDHFRLVWRQGHPRDLELRTLAHRLSRAPLR